MCICYDLSCWENCDTIQLLCTILLAILPYIILFFILRPKLKIACAYFDNGTLKIKVKNKGRFSAVNLRIEACAYDKKQEHTYHFKIDHEDFLILPRGKIKIFTVTDVAESARPYYKNENDLMEEIKSGKYQLRVRLHSYHSFSGLGKAEEKIFPCIS